MSTSLRDRDRRNEVYAELQRQETAKQEEIREVKQAERRQRLFSEPSEELATFVRPTNEPVGMTPQQFTEAVKSTVSQLRSELEGRGTPLAPEDLRHFESLFNVNGSLDLRDIEVWRAAHLLLFSLGFITQPVVESVVEPDPMAAAQERINNRSEAENDQILFSTYLNEIETQETETREGQRAARRKAFEAMLLESKPLFSEFRSHMRSVWNHPMLPKDCDAVVNFCVAHNLGFSHKSFDLARQQVLGCRTEEEQLAAEIEHVDINDYATKRNLKKRIHELAKQ